MPEQPKEARPLQENVRYWALLDGDGLIVSIWHRNPGTPAAGHTLTLVTLKAVSDD